VARIINTADLIQGALLPPNDAYWIYNGLDVCVTKEILDVIRPQLDNVTSATYQFSRDLQAPVLEMTMRGILVNQNRKSRVLAEFRKQLAQLESQLDEIVVDGIGATLNWRSPKQLGELLYDILNLPEQRKRNANGIMARTTNRDALEKLSSYFIAEPIVNHLLLLRDIGKSVSFLETGIDADGRMRSNFNIASTNTGRFASSVSDYGTGTNLQNVARLLRSVFCADPGYKFANLDLEQADSRNLGALCWDAFVNEMGEHEAGKYLDACEAGDLHTFVCKMCNPHLPWGDGRTDRAIADIILHRDKSYRDASKVLGHGSNYLGQPVTMAKHSKFPTNLVREFQEKYFGAFPVIPKYHGNVQWNLDNFGSLTTLYGRRRYFFGRKNDPATLREAVAYSPQSMTGDEINTGILKIWRGNKVQLLVQVHDSILFQYREEEEDEIVPWALENLRAPIVLAKGREFCVPTEAKVGWNWGDQSPDNVDGLKKYKGHDDRKRTETITKLSIRGW
jgi:DNA polymerase-1